MSATRSIAWGLCAVMAACSGTQSSAPSGGGTACALPPRDEPADVVSSDAATSSEMQTPSTPSCPAPAVSASAAEGLPMGAPASLVVANEHGVRELNMDGTVRRTLSTTPASRPRWGEAQLELFFLVPDRAELHAIAMDTCLERTVAVIPRRVGAGCGGAAEVREAVAEARGDADFLVAPDDGVACLRMLDFADDSSAGEAVVQITLADGTAHGVLVQSARCRETEVPEPCAHRLEAAREADNAGLPPIETTEALPFRTRGARIVRRGPDGREIAAGRIAAEDVTEESRSPSGRWVLLDANRETGGVAYRQLFLFDRQTGGVFPVRDGAWPAALTAAQLANRRVVREASARITSESPVRWLTETDLLLVGTVLINPGARSVRLDGDLAM